MTQESFTQDLTDYKHGQSDPKTLSIKTESKNKRNKRSANNIRVQTKTTSYLTSSSN